MASPISCLSILVIPLLVTSLFYQVSNADRALVESICHNSTDYEFCLSSLLSDERSIKSALPTLELISIELNLKVIAVAVNRIPDVRKTLTDPVDKTRLQNCESDIGDAHENMLRASDGAGFQNYDKAQTSLTAALLKIGECSDEYESSPKRQSPLSDLTFKMGRLIDISYVIINKILPV
ncbi:pectinesterase inhibitor 5-like [Quercus robur]|uniref:pectinesterase inhibitor 5-like n=1 Tax=Quercus robur TaxID=38942 RepID=UPI002163A40F|nr:pectinesterase inhibitor 5-like [Quercus robur]